MPQPAIKVQGLYKDHAKQQHATFYGLLSHTLKAPFTRLRNLDAQTMGDTIAHVFPASLNSTYAIFRP